MSAVEFERRVLFSVGIKPEAMLAKIWLGPGIRALHQVGKSEQQAIEMVRIEVQKLQKMMESDIQ